MTLGSLIIVAIAAGVCLVGDAKGQRCRGGRCGALTCNTNSDCPLGQCCITNSPFRGKRGAYPVRDAGVCAALGGPNDGCLVEQAGPLDPTTLMQRNCPCREDLTCTGTGISEVPQGEHGVCEPAALECNTNVDCPHFHCCVSTVRPIGKRGVPQFTGTCKRLGQLGYSCLVRNTLPLASDQSHYVSCPCRINLDCVGTGVRDIPLGEVGRCQRRGRGWGRSPGRRNRGRGRGGRPGK